MEDLDETMRKMAQEATMMAGSAKGMTKASIMSHLLSQSLFGLSVDGSEDQKWLDRAERLADQILRRCGVE